MGVSVSNILFKVGMNTRGYEAGVKSVQTGQRRLRELEAKNALDKKDELKALHRAMEEIDQKNAEYKESSIKLAEAQKKLAAAIKYASDEERAAGQITKEADDRLTKAKSTVDKLKKSKESLRKEIDKLDNGLKKLQDTTVSNRKKRVDEINLTRAEIKELKSKQSILGGLNKTLTGLGIGATIGTAAHQFTKMVNTLDAMAKRARDVQMTASQLQELTHQANLAGVGAGTLDTSIKSFNRNISLAAMNTGKAKDALARMGIALKDANGESKTQAQLLQETAYYFADNAGNAENAGLAARLFGESGAEMLRIFENGRETIDAVFNANKIDAAAAAAEEFNRNMSELSNNIMPSVYKVVGDIADVLNYQINPERFFTIMAEKQVESINLTKAQKKELIDVSAQLLKLEEQRSKTPRRITANPHGAGLFIAPKLVDNPAYKKLEEQIAALNERQSKLTEEAKKQEELNERITAGKKSQAALNERLAAQEAERLRQEQQSYEELYQLTLATAEARDKEDADAKKAADEARRLQLKRDEYDLQLRIKQLESGDNRQQAAADALKNSIERNRLMKEYGFSIEEATERLKAQRELENGNNNQAQYSDADRKKAERILKRGEKGTVGKKTLEQAQAILDGKEIEGDAVDMFKGAQRNAQRNKKKNSNKTKFATDEQMESARNAINKNAQPQDQQLQAQQQGNDQQNENQQKLLDNTDKTVENTQSLVDAINDLKDTVEIMKNSMMQYYSK